MNLVIEFFNFLFLSLYKTMKTVIQYLCVLIIIVVILVSKLSAQNNYYYYNGEKIFLELSTEKVLIKFSKELTFNEARQITLSESVLNPLDDSRGFIPNGIVIVDVIEGATQVQVKGCINKLEQNKDVICANYFLKYKDGTLQGITDHFIVKLKSPNDFFELENLAKETKTIIIKENEFEPNVFILSATKNSNGNALEMANYFYETGKFEYAEPDFLKLLKRFCRNDEFFSDQWGLLNTGQHSGISGEDIDVCQAWEITTGRDVIDIAVIDEGVDLNHPDLINNLLPGFDATGQGSNGGPQGDDAHGTACAGIIAATANNNIGIAGIAHTSRIIPVRIAFGDGFGGWITNTTWISNGINWAWQNGAEILSNSWGGGSPSNDITNAINNAVNNGRDGLGCPVFFATGNNNGSVSYPAILADVIAVGAMSMCNERKNPSSCDGENWWGSNFGAELDIVAPGVLIPTTDIAGADGYETGDYTPGFNGTSSACPHAAGVMALILSVNRCLTQAEARQILELSCDKVGGAYCYNTTSGHPNGTWNDEMGYGRINAFRAVQYATSTQINTYNNVGGGVDQGAGDSYQFLLFDVCSNFSLVTFFVIRHEVHTNISYPFMPNPTIIGTSNGFSDTNPNNGNFWMSAINVTPTSATLITNVYEAYDDFAQFISWVPTSPANIRFDYTILNIVETDIYLQNQTVTGTEVHNAMNLIAAGKNVTNAVPIGDYVISSGANVTFHAGNLIRLTDGFRASPGTGGFFRATVERFFTCTEFPNGRVANPNSNYYITNYETVKIEEDNNDVTNTIFESNTFNIYPNPFTNNTTIEYQINNSENVTISIYNICGDELVRLKNKQKHEAGIYQVRFEGINLRTGNYLITIETDDFKETKQIVKVN